MVNILAKNVFFVNRASPDDETSRELVAVVETGRGRRSVTVSYSDDKHVMRAALGAQGIRWTAETVRAFDRAWALDRAEVMEKRRASRRATHTRDRQSKPCGAWRQVRAARRQQPRRSARRASVPVTSGDDSGGGGSDDGGDGEGGPRGVAAHKNVLAAGQGAYRHTCIRAALGWTAFFVQKFFSVCFKTILLQRQVRRWAA